jgi:hypothetical protein
MLEASMSSSSSPESLGRFQVGEFIRSFGDAESLADSPEPAGVSKYRGGDVELAWLRCRRCRLHGRSNWLSSLSGSHA